MGNTLADMPELHEEIASFTFSAFASFPISLSLSLIPFLSLSLSL